jgi:hypothetical protein
MNARAISLLLASICLGASGLLPGSAWGQSKAVQPPAELDAKPIGKVLNATGSVTIEHTSAVLVQANITANGTVRVKTDDPVYRGDLVQTGADSAVDIVFADGTSFKVSSNARMELNDFVYDPAGSSNSTLFSLSKGSFTFLAGAIAKTGNMKVDTPVGTMGIRGTAPHVEILEDGTVKFTTLIEENKSATDEHKTAPAAAPRKRAQNPSSSDTAASLQAERDLVKKLKICQGC